MEVEAQFFTDSLHGEIFWQDFPDDALEFFIVPHLH
jgi:hypothetical protein